MELDFSVSVGLVWNIILIKAASMILGGTETSINHSSVAQSSNMKYFKNKCIYKLRKIFLAIFIGKQREQTFMWIVSEYLTNNRGF